jgi:heme-degrading monooxygenase HmoA
MPLTVTITTTKPDDIIWFRDSSEENRQAVARIKAWTESQPGFISHTTVDIDLNTIVMIFDWDSVENYANWFSLRDALPEQIARREYSRVNGLISTVNETLS